MTNPVFLSIIISININISILILVLVLVLVSVLVFVLILIFALLLLLLLLECGAIRVGVPDIWWTNRFRLSADLWCKSLST